MIEFKRVTCRYEGFTRTALTDIDLQISSGEFVLFCGPSGSGKTTAIRLMNGIIPHLQPAEVEGEILLDGQSVSEQPMWRLAQRVGSVFQNPKAGFFNSDVVSEIVFGMENSGIPLDAMTRRLAAVTQDCGVENLLGRSIFELSGGEAQRISIAAALALEPGVLVFDEPSSNLDEMGIGALRALLIRAKSLGQTIIIAEHRLWYLADLVDWAYCFADGRVVEKFDGPGLASLTDDRRQELGLRKLTRPTPPNSDSRPGGNEQALLSVDDLSFRYGRRQVFDNVAFHVAVQETGAIVGPNGSGKTSMVRCLTGLARPSTGTISWQGESVSGRWLRKHACLVMQNVNHQLFAETVRAEVSLGSPATTDTIHAVLANLDLEHLVNRHPRTLSGGQRQRLAIACACLSRRPIAVLDEPTSGLDHHHMTQVAKLLAEQANQERCVVVVTHDPEFIDVLGAQQLIWKPQSDERQVDQKIKELR